MASRAVWVTCLASGCRTAVACAVVAFATLYGPAALRRQVTFPAFSYVTAILIVTNATVGDAVRGCWLALYATLQTVCPAMVVFWFIGPTKFSYETIALTVALASLVVLLPSSTHLLAKRIALGQIVIIYVVGFIGGASTEPLMHPLHVAATTAMGAAASVCATLLPFPRLAFLEVKEKRKEVVENVGERLGLLLKALLSDNDAVAAGSISKALLLSTSATKLLRHIRQYQPSMQWEWVPLKKWRAGCVRLQELETPLRGMELALSNIPSYPIETLQNEPLKHALNASENHIRQSLKQANAHPPSDSHTFPESNPDDDDAMNTVDLIHTMPTNPQHDLPPLFFIFCMNLLCHNSNNKPQPPNKPEPKQSKSSIWTSWAPQVTPLPALKSAIALGIAAFLGLIYSKENGFWASLGVAVSIGSGREATFKVANLKLQGTVVGSVYGVLCFVVLEKYLLGRLLCLLPWFVFRASRESEDSPSYSREFSNSDFKAQSKYKPLTPEAVITREEFDLMKHRFDEQVEALKAKCEKKECSFDDGDLGESPFTSDILEVPIPPKFKTPTMKLYDRSKDPKDYVEVFEGLMDFQAATDAIKCSAFQIALTGSARLWYRRLPARSISTYSQLRKEFISQFFSRHYDRKTATHLATIRQKEGETLREYVTRFQEE
ncbi:uncharacterized protein LOC111024503 [Momordica charantia]|uniref:Uncharacterized protein LOC111024503 n=1 Tax=Momordica charantia TaxID=3673 RepID=A0A6J1DVR0_MOMCH|nr:uncharacterized protein LOC111024503 [Momordica charantia]